MFQVLPRYPWPFGVMPFSSAAIVSSSCPTTRSSIIRSKRGVYPSNESEALSREDFVAGTSVPVSFLWPFLGLKCKQVSIDLVPPHLLLSESLTFKSGNGGEVRLCPGE